MRLQRLLFGLAIFVVLAESALLAARTASAARSASIVAPAPPDPEPARLPAQVGWTTEDHVNLREGPGTGYDILAQLPDETRLEITGELEGWYHVTTPWGADGWLAVDFVEVSVQGGGVSHDDEPRIGTGAVVADNLFLRTGAGSGYNSLGKMPSGTQVEILDQEGDWYRLRTPSGSVGWATGEYVVLDRPLELFGQPAALPAAAMDSDAVRIAHRYLGTRYLWGGASPVGFDCSGLIYYVYKQLGVWLPRTADKQLNTAYGELVRGTANLEPGDLLFFDRTTSDPGITHVGIYAGDGMMIAARSERLGVGYASLEEPFWRTRYWVGLRLYR